MYRVVYDAEDRTPILTKPRRVKEETEGEQERSREIQIFVAYAMRENIPRNRRVFHRALVRPRAVSSIERRTERLERGKHPG